MTFTGAGELRAQAGPDGPAAGVISGRVVDAETLAPLVGARVVLERAEPQPRPTPFRAAVTDSAGGYRFGGLPPARYRVLVERIGYLTRFLEVELGRAGSVPVSIGLQIQPILLPALEVTGRVPQPFESTRDPDADVVGTRAAVARLRQEAHLSSDARELTHGEVIQAVTLGEPDLFRALQRIPGVATRDDYTATIWTRGASWDQTRIYFDGLELYNPTHAGWLFSAVNPDAIGAVLFQPGYRSSRWGEGTAAILDLRSRSGSPVESFRGTAELSPASARLALDGSLSDGRLRWMVAGRRTYVDLLTGLIGSATGDDDLVVPYDFSDVVFRVDGRTDEGWGFEASSILERDHLRGDLRGIVTGNRGKWGNRAGQITLATPEWSFGLGPVRSRIMAGQTLFGTRVEADSTIFAQGRPDQIPPLRNDVRHQTFSVEARPARADSLAWAAGVQVVRDEIRYAGPASMLDILIAARLDSIPGRDYTDAQVYTAFWGERRWSLGDRLEFEAGARLEYGDAVANGGRLRVSPRAVARARIAPATYLSGSWSRAYQYTQDVSPAAGPVGPQLHLSAIWLLATTSPFFPAARADVTNVGVESWLGEEWLATLNVYHRRATGLLIPNPDTGVVRGGREPDAVASNTAAGFEASLRRLMGRWTGSVGYTYGTSRMVSFVERPTGDTVRFDFPAQADVPHAVDVTGTVELGRGFRLGGAFTFGSGVPFTRVVLPDTARPPEQRGDPRIEAPYAERTRSYSSLDLMLEYSTTFGAWRVSAYGQIRNALGSENAVTYLGSRDCAGIGGPLAGVGSIGVDCQGVAPGGGVKDQFEEGLPMLPLFGLRVTF